MDEAVAKRFGKKKQLKSTVVPIYPKSAEREMQRLVNAYMAEIIKEIRESELSEMRTDAKGLDLRNLERIAERVKLESRLKKISGQIEGQSFREWRKCVEKTLGVILPESYYVGGLYEPEASKWLLEMMQKLKSLPSIVLAALKSVISKAVKAGKSVADIRKVVNKKIASLKRTARATTIMGVAELFGELNKLQQRDAGCRQYYWKSARDNRVRPCHRALDGHVFEWDNPPEMWRETKHGRVYTGMRCNPGEDYGCRCVAVPVFDLEGLNIPDQNGGK